MCAIATIRRSCALAFAKAVGVTPAEKPARHAEQTFGGRTSAPFPWRKARYRTLRRYARFPAGTSAGRFVSWRGPRHAERVFGVSDTHCSANVACLVAMARVRNETCAKRGAQDGQKTGGRPLWQIGLKP